MKNHAFLIQAHRYPALLARILAALKAKNHYFAINIDGKSSEYLELTEIAKKQPNLICLTNDRISHGGFSQVECTIRQLRHCASYLPQIDYFHSISGQDYPCLSNQAFDAIFANSEQSFLMLDTPEEVAAARAYKYHKRLSQYHLNDVLTAPFWRKPDLLRVSRFLLGVFPRPYKDIDAIWSGWNWFSLHRRASEYLLSFINKNPTFYERFRHTFCPDELFFGTVLRPMHEELNIELRNCFRYIDWHPKRPYKALPLVLNSSDYNSIVSSKAAFCRKVAPEESKELLDLLDAYRC